MYKETQHIKMKSHFTQNLLYLFTCKAILGRVIPK